MNNKASWQEGLRRAEATGTPHVLITILAISGSAPRRSGSKMVVTHDCVYDTIGGGQLELMATQRARAVLQGELPAQQQIQHYPLAAAASQCCGGSMTLLFDPLAMHLPHVVIFGAGHVGQSMLGLLDGLPLTTTVLDSRQDWLDSAVAQQKILVNEDALDAAELAGKVPRNAWVFVLTHDHLMDFALVKELLKRSDLNFLGMIGSQTKWHNFSIRLRRDGASEAELARVRCPIGEGGSTFKEPSAIAIDVIAKLLRDISQADGSGAANDPVAEFEDTSGVLLTSKKVLRDEVPGLFP